MLIVFAVSVTNAAEADTVTRGPYLQMGTHDRIVVRWRTDVATDSRVSYGLCSVQPDCLMWAAVDSTVTTEHEITLSGLSPNTRYYYAVGTTTQFLAGDDDSHFFLTSPPVGISKPTRIWVLGDSGTATANARAVRDAYYWFTGARHTDLWLMLGDNAYENGSDTQYQAAVFNMFPEMLRKSVLWPTFGNHDGGSANSATQSGPYYDMFTLPKNAEAGGLPSGTEAYYSYDYGNIHFIVLNSYDLDRSPDGAMINWLRADLQATDQDWIVAYWHHPPYSKGSHNSNTEMALREMRQYVLPVLEDYGVDLVLAGHSHAYERSFLLDRHYGLSNTLVSGMILDSGDGRPAGNGAYVKPSRGADPHSGTVYAVAGTSGKASGGPLNHPAMFVSLNVLGSLVLDVDRNRLDATFLQSTGAVGDTFTILKGSWSDIEVAPNPYDYGPVGVGTERLRTFTIRNVQSADLQVTASLIGGEADEFAIAEGDAPFTVAPGATRTLNIPFTPTSFGHKTTTLRLAMDNPDTSPVGVALSGTGTAPPDIDVAPTPHDYGEVLVGTTTSRTFVLRNLGGADLQVTATSLVGGEAGEFAITSGEAPFTLAPDEVHTLDVRFTPTAGGPKTTTLQLTSDDPDEALVDVALGGTATTAPEIDVAPTLHDYGQVLVGTTDVVVGTTASRTVAIRNVGSADLHVTVTSLVGGDASEFAMTSGGAPFTIAPGTTYTLDIRLAPTSGGLKTTTLRLTNDDQDEAIVDVVLNGTAITAPEIAAAPMAHDYHVLWVGAAASRTVTIRNGGSADLHVTETSLVGGEASEFVITSGGAPFTVVPGATHTLDVHFVPTSAGPKTTTLRLTSDDQDEATVDVALSGTGILPPDLDVTPTPHDFGEVLVGTTDVVIGTTASRTFVIRNLGGVDLQVSATSLAGDETGEFAITSGGAPFTVVPGATHTLDVRFAPTSGGPKTTVLRLTSDDPDEAIVDVPLSGTATTAPELAVTPTLHDFGEVLVGTPDVIVGTTASRTVTIRNGGSAELHVTAASLVGGDASEFAITSGRAPVTVAPGVTRTLDVRFGPTSGGPKTTTLQLTSDDLDEAIVEVTLNGMATTAPEIVVAPTTHNYEVIWVGARASRTVTIRNGGSADLHVTPSLIDGEAGEFVIGGHRSPSPPARRTCSTSRSRPFRPVPRPRRCG